MTQVTSLEARFKAEGAQEVKNGFEQIARAAVLAKREMQVASQNMRDDAKKLIQTEKEKAAAVVKAEKEAAAAVRKSAAEQKRSNREMLASLKSFAVAAVAAAVAIKKFYDFAKQGAELELTAYKFDRLAKSIGTTGDLLLGKMKEATRGTLSDMEAMGAATDLMSLGLANSSDQAVRLARVQSGLAMDTNNLVLTLTNMRTMRFDQLGVSVNGFKERLDGLKETMKGASEQDIFKEAFLQQAEEQLLKVGNAADTAAGDFMKFEANVKNAGDELRKTASAAVLPVVKQYNDLKTAQDAVKSAFDSGAISKKEYARVLAQLFKHTVEYSDVIEKYKKNVEEVDEVYKVHVTTLDDVLQAEEEAKKAINESITSRIGLINKMQSADESYTEKSTDLANSRMEIEAELASLRAQGYWEQGEQIQGAIAKLEEIKQKEAELEKERARQSLQFISSILAENLARDGWTQNEFEAFAAQQVAWGLWSEDVAANAQKAMDEANAITEAINAIPEAKTITITTYAQTIQRMYAADNGAGFNAAHPMGHATGGSFTIPAQYGHEGFMLGGGNTASGGETVTVTPKGGANNNSEIVRAIEANRISESALARAFITAMQSVGEQ